MSDGRVAFNSQPAEASALVRLAGALALVDINEGREPHGYRPSGHAAFDFQPAEASASGEKYMPQPSPPEEVRRLRAVLH